jgi:hypothetical protein
VAELGGLRNQRGLLGVETLGGGAVHWDEEGLLRANRKELRLTGRVDRGARKRSGRSGPRRRRGLLDRAVAALEEGILDDAWRTRALFVNGECKIVRRLDGCLLYLG